MVDSEDRSEAVEHLLKPKQFKKRILFLNVTGFTLGKPLNSVVQRPRSSLFDCRRVLFLGQMGVRGCTGDLTQLEWDHLHTHTHTHTGTRCKTYTHTHKWRITSQTHSTLISSQALLFTLKSPTIHRAASHRQSRATVELGQEVFFSHPALQSTKIPPAFASFQESVLICAPLTSMKSIPLSTSA